MNDQNHDFNSSRDGVEQAKLIRTMDDLPEARAYLDRIGARATGPWTAAIHFERDGYDFDRMSIRLIFDEREGRKIVTEVKCRSDDSDHQPTEAESRAIIDAARLVRWPKVAWVAKLGREGLPRQIAEAAAENLFVFREPSHGNNFCYVQVRNPDPTVTGRGKYTSWLHIEADEWISGQPDRLPLYGAEQLMKGSHSRIFIHEGPKAADRVTKFLDASRPGNRLDHPWAEFLASGIHLGWPGGGDRYRKVDWSILDLENHAEVIAVSDRDDVGITAAEAIAGTYVKASHKPRVLLWPTSFPRGFDLGDEWPDSPPGLEAMVVRPKFVGDARATEFAQLTKEVAERLGERGLVFSHSQRATVIVRQASAILKDPDDPDRKRPAIRVRTVDADAEMLRPYVEEVSRWQKRDGRRRGEDDRMVNAAVPGLLLQQLVRQQQLLEPLAGAVDYPIISNGRLLTGNIGYDRDSRLFINSPHIEVEEWSDPEVALRFLEEDWLGRFPFATRCDRLRMLTLPPTLMLRPADIRGGAPFYFFVSGSAQIGKSWAARCLCAVVLGSPPPVASWPEKPEELKKQLLASAMESPPVIFYDNVTNRWKVGGGPLDGYGTSDEIQDRILGESKTATATALSVLIFSGNNIAPKQDTTTRSVIGRLRMSEQKHPDLDSAMDFTMANRGRILGAYLAILKVATAPLPSGLRFPDWGRLVAGPIMTVAGQPDMLQDMAEAHRSAAHGSAELGPVLRAVHRLQQGNGWLTVADMLGDDLCSAALHELFPKKEGRWTASGLGVKLPGYEDNFAEGLTLRMEERKRQNGSSFKVYRVDGEPDDGEAGDDEELPFL